MVEDVEFGEPLNFKEIISPWDAMKWSAAMVEILSLQKNETWTLVEPPKGKRVIGCKRMFKIEDDTIDIWYVAKFVGKSYLHMECVDFNGIFSLVVNTYIHLNFIFCWLPWD